MHALQHQGNRLPELSAVGLEVMVLLECSIEINTNPLLTLGHRVLRQYSSAASVALLPRRPDSPLVPHTPQSPGSGRRYRDPCSRKPSAPGLVPEPPRQEP